MVSIASVQDKVFKALADPSRRAIFETLARWGGQGAGERAGENAGKHAGGISGGGGGGGEAAVKDLTACFKISQPAISQHLAALTDAGLVYGRRRGRCVYYRVDPRGMKPLIDWIAHYRAFWTEHVDRLEQLLARMEDK